MKFTISMQVVAFILVFGLSLLAGPLIIPLLKKLKYGQTVRDDGPTSHISKTGTPTIGGLIFIIPILLTGAYYSIHLSRMIPLLLVITGFGAVGFLDDYLKVKRKSKDGLSARSKMLGLIIISVIFSVWVAYFSEGGTSMAIPFYGMDCFITIPVWIFIPFSVFVLISMSNAVNLTDGVDGLAAGVTLIVAVFFTIISMTTAQYENIKVFSSMIAGGCLGFMAFNFHPAKVFMGDTGSLALGGSIAAVSIILKIPWVLLTAGIIYVIEALSVIIQVASFKLRGKRIFKMAPIHHHFELKGWSEIKVVSVFAIITVFACIISFILLRMGV